MLDFIIFIFELPFRSQPPDVFSFSEPSFYASANIVVGWLEPKWYPCFWLLIESRMGRNRKSALDSCYK